MQFNKKKIVPVVVSSAATLLVVFAVLLFFQTDALVQKTDSSWVHARVVFKCGDVVLVRSSETFAKKEDAEAAEPGMNFSVLSVDRITLIEFIKKADDWSEGQKESAINFPYSGKYKINASGHEGFLIVGCGEKSCWGTVQFPNWGNGVVETLKRVRFDGKRIYFLRSATTVKELRRVGASEYYTQEYTGEFSKDGQILTGFYKSRGAKFQWKGERIKR